MKGAKRNRKPRRNKKPSVPCPTCHHPLTTIDRTYSVGTILKRTRRCLECDRTFSTKEIATSGDELATGVAALGKLLDSPGLIQKFLKQSHERTDAP